jgi:hypothetical protein
MNTFKTCGKRKAWMRKFWKILKVFQPLAEGNDNQNKKKTEFNGLKKFYDQVMVNLNGSPLDKQQWMEKVLPYILRLPMDFQTTVQDLFKDFKKRTPPI